MSKQWFYSLDDAQTGPVSEEEINHLIRNGDIKAETLIWSEGMQDWELAKWHFETKRRFATPVLPRSGRAEQGDPGLTGQSRAATGGLYSGAPARGFTDAVGTCLRRYFGFSGRASRSEFWYFMLFGILLGTAGGILDAVALGYRGRADGPVAGIITLLLFFPSLASAFRRLHDTGRSGAWALLLYLAPLILVPAIFAIGFLFAGQGGMILLIAAIGTNLAILVYVLVLLCTKGDAGPNAYG